MRLAFSVALGVFFSTIFGAYWHGCCCSHSNRLFQRSFWSFFLFSFCGVLLWFWRSFKISCRDYLFWSSFCDAPRLYIGLGHTQKCGEDVKDRTDRSRSHVRPGQNVSVLFCDSFFGCFYCALGLLRCPFSSLSKIPTKIARLYCAFAFKLSTLKCLIFERAGPFLAPLFEWIVAL